MVTIIGDVIQIVGWSIAFVGTGALIGKYVDWRQKNENC